jgi:hypothetical protein
MKLPVVVVDTVVPVAVIATGISAGDTQEISGLTKVCQQKPSFFRKLRAGKPDWAEIHFGLLMTPGTSADRDLRNK